ncbi:MAG TPA: hypothetical protein VF444_00875 [Pseudonocardiaceae bacterium]
MVDWGAGPFWVSANGGISDPYDADEITEIVPLSEELRASVEEWDQRFQSTYNDAEPQESGIRDPVARAAHIADGRQLASRVKAEAPSGVTIEYVDIAGEEWPVTGEEPLP